jgi:hypothetical protein
MSTRPFVDEGAFAVMTRDELVDAYQRGLLSRRSFIRALTALGLTMAAANRLADSAAAARRPQWTADDVYGSGQTIQGKRIFNAFQTLKKGLNGTSPSTTSTTTTSGGGRRGR